MQLLQVCFAHICNRKYHVPSKKRSDLDFFNFLIVEFLTSCFTTNCFDVWLHSKVFTKDATFVKTKQGMYGNRGLTKFNIYDVE